MGLIADWLRFSSATIMAIMGSWLGAACFATIFDEKRTGKAGKWPHELLGLAGLGGLLALAMGMFMIVTWRPLFI